VFRRHFSCQGKPGRIYQKGDKERTQEHPYAPRSQHTDDYRALIADLKTRIRSAQIKAALTVNSQLIALYWDIGKLIVEKQRASG
jgi:hypothetical protein